MLKRGKHLTGHSFSHSRSLAAVKYLTNRRELEKAANKLGELGPRAGLGSLASWEGQPRTYVPGWGAARKRTTKNICSRPRRNKQKGQPRTYVLGCPLGWFKRSGEHMFWVFIGLHRTYVRGTGDSNY